MENIIVARNLKRDFKSKTGVIRRSEKVVNAVKGISFDVQAGEIFGLLGPNGAGKTTTIKMMTTLLLPSEGKLQIMGRDIETEEKFIRENINFVFGGERSLYWRLSGEDNMRFFADVYKVPRTIQKTKIFELLKIVGLYEERLQKVETYSKGMKQRLQIAKALINNPKILFLDEPTIGLDPVGSKMLHKLIRLQAKNGTTIILTTHYMKEAEDLCDRIAILDKGELKALGNMDELIQSCTSTKIATSLEDVYLHLVETKEGE